MKVLVVAGPSAGHSYPAVAFIERLKERCDYAAVQLVLPYSAVRKISFYPPCPVQYVNVSTPAPNIKKIAEFINGWVKSFFILVRFQPDIVVGFGSIVSVPFVIFAWLLRMKTLIHEQNVLPGRANKLLAVFADKIAVSFDQTKQYFRNYLPKLTVTGNPLRKKIIRLDRAAALNYLGLASDKRTILVMGGSQASSKINREFIQAVSLLKDSNIQVIHLSGSKDFGVLKQGYEKLNIKFCLFAFFDFMEYAYSAADLVVSRAGATSIAEIIFYQLPAILIPYPYAYQHQLINAKVLEEKGCGVIIEEENLGAAGALKEKLQWFLDNQSKLAEMRAAYQKFPKTDAGELLVNQIA